MIKEATNIPQRTGKALVPSSSIAYIAIHDSGTLLDSEIPREGWGYFNHIDFDDAAYDEEIINDWGPGFTDAFKDSPHKIDALKILVMLKEIDELKITKLIVQCDSGRSRSAAVVEFISEKNNINMYDSDTNLSYANSLLTSLLKDPYKFDEAIDIYVNGNGKKPTEPVTQKNKRLAGLEKLISYPSKKLDQLLSRLFSKTAK